MDESLQSDLTRVVQRLTDFAAKFALDVPKTPNEWQRTQGRLAPRVTDGLFPIVGEFLELIRRSAPDARAAAIANLRPESRALLRAFVALAGVLAVRKQDGSLIEQGIWAVSVLGDVDDYRDLLFSVAILYHCSQKLGISPVHVFNEAADSAADATLQREMRDFPKRPPKTRNLEAFCLREQITDGEFDVVQGVAEIDKKFYRFLRRSGNGSNTSRQRWW
ncbi:MAG: hypothetical protein ABL995_08220 [Bryobacteraceae bacterium]